MIPKPPFPWDLSPERERTEFERLKPQLASFWSTAFPRDELPYTSVVVPSISLDAAALARMPGAVFREERLLFLLIRLRNPRARLVYVTSRPLHPLVLEYYLQLLAGIPASHARARLTLLSAHDASDVPLTQKILQRPRLLQRIRAAIRDPSLAYLTVYNSTPLERRLSVLLGIPLNSVDPNLTGLGTKSGSRKLFRDAGVDQPFGFEGLRTEPEVAGALVALKSQRPGLRRALLKLDDSLSGEGNAVFEYPESLAPGAIEAALGRLAFSAVGEGQASYFSEYARTGGVVEEFLEGQQSSSPSVQLRINPRGETFLVSTHEQILGGPNGLAYRGCVFPANEAYRARLCDIGLGIGRLLSAKGVVGRLSIDFLAIRDAGPLDWRLYAVEINLRMGGTTHPMLALRFLTGGQLDPGTGLFRSLAGQPKFYRASDDVCSERYRGLLPEDLIDIVTVNRLHFSPATLTGVLFHTIGAISEQGRFGMIAIGDSPEHVDEMWARAAEILDAETRYGPAGSGEPGEP